MREIPFYSPAHIKRYYTPNIFIYLLCGIRMDVSLYIYECDLCIVLARASGKQYHDPAIKVHIITGCSFYTQSSKEKYQKKISSKKQKKLTYTSDRFNTEKKEENQRKKEDEQNEKK